VSPWRVPSSRNRNCSCATNRLAIWITNRPMSSLRFCLNYTNSRRRFSLSLPTALSWLPVSPLVLN
jgi:hypothetical protein